MWWLVKIVVMASCLVFVANAQVLTDTGAFTYTTRAGGTFKMPVPTSVDSRSAARPPWFISFFENMNFGGTEWYIPIAFHFVASQKTMCPPTARATGWKNPVKSLHSGCEDSAISPRCYKTDTFGAPYDRGHVCSHRLSAAYSPQSFTTANMFPQHQSFNRGGLWKQRETEFANHLLEKKGKELQFRQLHLWDWNRSSKVFAVNNLPSGIPTPKYVLQIVNYKEVNPTCFYVLWCNPITQSNTFHDNCFEDARISIDAIISKVQEMREGLTSKALNIFKEVEEVLEHIRTNVNANNNIFCNFLNRRRRRGTVDEMVNIEAGLEGYFEETEGANVDFPFDLTLNGETQSTSENSYYCLLCGAVEPENGKPRYSFRSSCRTE